MVTSSTQVREAYRECERITRTRAANFSYGIRLLAPTKRRALSAVYAFARRVDDIGDGDLPVERKLSELDRARDDIRSVSLDSADPVLVGLADAATRLPIPLGAFDELIDGCEADVRGVRYRTFDELLLYCRHVAGSIGRLSLGVFGAADQATAQPHADALGVALQLTNILRDLREDRLNGRIYLPAEDLEKFGVHLDLTTEGALADSTEKLAGLIHFQAQRADRWYADGFRLLPMLDRRSRACCASMAGIYHELLQRIAAHPAIVVRHRASLSGWAKAGVAARSLVGKVP